MKKTLIALMYSYDYDLQLVPVYVPYAFYKAKAERDTLDNKVEVTHG